MKRTRFWHRQRVLAPIAPVRTGLGDRWMILGYANILTVNKPAGPGLLNESDEITDEHAVIRPAVIRPAVIRPAELFFKLLKSLRC